MTSKAVNVNKQAFSIMIDRGTIWGNPYYRDDVKTNILNFKKYFWNSDLPDKLDRLWDRKLGCHCKPHSCHGDFLATEANYLQAVVRLPKKIRATILNNKFYRIYFIKDGHTVVRVGRTIKPTSIDFDNLESFSEVLPGSIYFQKYASEDRPKKGSYFSIVDSNILGIIEYEVN